jgi:hypothetical protein
MCRIASYTVADYWFRHYKITNGLDCGHCSKAQRAKCKEDDLYSECPKAIKLEYLSKPIIDGEGNITELGDLYSGSTDYASVVRVIGSLLIRHLVALPTIETSQRG